MHQKYSLVAAYGPKHPSVKAYFSSLQEKIRGTALAPYFVPYEAERIHATICGLERLETESGWKNLFLYEQTGQIKEMKWQGIDSWMQAFFPLPIQFGGWHQSDETLKSGGSTFFERSFWADTNSRRTTLMGWPISHPEKLNAFDNEKPLWKCRKALSDDRNIRHKYWDRKDNDAYLVLGTLAKRDSMIPPHISQEASLILRNYLAENPFIWTVAFRDLKVVSFTHPTLPLEGTKYWSLQKFIADILPGLS